MGLRKSAITAVISLLVVSMPAQSAEIWQDFKDYLRQPTQWQEKEWLTLGGIALLTATAIQYDESVRSGFAANQTPTGDQLASIGNAWGELDSLGGVTLLSLYLTGKLNDNPQLVQLSANSFEAVVLSGFTTGAGKVLFGRTRPNATSSSADWWQGDKSFPSGHTTMAFALSTVLAESTDNPSFGRRLFFYSLASLTAYSRMYDQKHWLSDTMAGAAIGINAGLYVVNRHKQSPAKQQTRMMLLPNGVYFYRSFG
ncbi:MAG: phosphatase PAP2 family protein [Gammaproteobacteria bacterium]|nr:phosphatase PAP2 family protein [Gammaproteobacteria bacterium]